MKIVALFKLFEQSIIMLIIWKHEWNHLVAVVMFQACM